jgi:hypothetical protein
MYIPTQEERYSKRSLLTLMLCVIAPCGVYAFSLSNKFSEPLQALGLPDGMGWAEMLIYFSYPLAYGLAHIGLPWTAGVIVSILVHAGILTFIYTRKEMTVKTMISWAIGLGMADLLAMKLINCFV